jgi:hypothetical protein
MWNKPTEKELSSIPGLYETERIPLKDKIIQMHFFLAGSDWYICEYDPKEQVFFGFVVLNQDFLNAEWGYISLKELERVDAGRSEVDRDLYWQKRKARQVKKICLANVWPTRKAF